MRAEQIRVRVRLTKDAKAEEFLASAEEALGHPVQLIRRLRTVPVLSLRLLNTELETLRRLPGVESAEPEERLTLPRPPHPRQERK